MNKVKFKSVLCMSIGVLTISFFSPTLQNVAKASENTENVNYEIDKSEQKEIELQREKLDEFTREFEKRNLNLSDEEYNNVFMNELIQQDFYIEYTNREMEIKENEISTYGIVGVGLKGIKYFGYLCRIGGEALAIPLRLLSPSKAALVRKYSAKIANATAKLEKGTKSALVSALKKAGIPSDVAKDLADIILLLV